MRNAPTISALDLTGCDREPIHIPGAIQAHGVLFAMNGADRRINAVAANVADHLGHAPSSLLGCAFSELVEPPSNDLIDEAADQPGGDTPSLINLTFKGATASWRALIHKVDAGFLLEAKLPRPAADPNAGTLFGRFDVASRRVQAVRGVVPTCERLAREIRELTGYDRVKVYRFGPDWSGEVIAEDRDEDMPAYHGLRFPASDIPAQARALYALNPERQIPDVDYRPVALVQSDPAPIDLSRAALRSVSPAHIQYLRNMGVGASMSISIMRDGRLWGLVACHHRSAHYIAPELRQTALLLTQFAAWQLSMSEAAASAHRSAGVRAIEAKLLHMDKAGGDYREALLRNGAELLDLLQASGAALSSGGSLTSLGRTPSEEDLRGLVEFLSEMGPNVFATDHLAGSYPAAASLADVAAGILMVPLGTVPQNMMIWFRPEVARTVTWGGDPAKPVDVGQDRLDPRRSFEAWTEQVRGRSRPWGDVEVEAANGLRDMIVDIILRHSLDLERVNERLVRTNEELESFTYVASHDLKEPLRQIETFGSMLERAFKDRRASPDKVARWFKGIQFSSRRLRLLIDDLAAYSKLGRQANPFVPTALDRLFDNVRSDLAPAIEEAHASIVSTPLPVIPCDPIQLQQVLQNIIANALKYRDAERAPVITITAETVPSSERSPSLRSVVLSIADNGIGFDERHRERIFEPFYRLHSADAYEGSGVGLAICRKIVLRHGGTITARSRPGEGATFLITLPIRPVPDQRDDA